jgi:hypothetical protein
MRRVLCLLVWAFWTLFAQESVIAQRLNPKEAQELENLWSRAQLNYQIAIEKQSPPTSNNLRAAFDDFSAILSRLPNNANAHFMRSVVAFSMMNYQESFADMQSALRYDARLAQKPLQYTMRSPIEKQNFEGFIALAAKQFVRADSLLANLYQPEMIRERGALYYYRAMAKFGLRKSETGCEDCRIAEELGAAGAEELFARNCSQADVVLDKSFPRNFQFFAREANDSARLSLSGVVRRAGVDSVVVVVYRNGEAVARQSVELTAVSTSSKESAKSSQKQVTKLLGKQWQVPFTVPISIKAECAQYGFVLGLKDKSGVEQTVARRDSLVAGDVFLFGGQSNMVLGDVPPSPKAAFMRTYNRENIASWWQTMAATNGFSGRLGRSGALSGELARRIVEERGIPVCGIYASVNGSSIEQHFPQRKNLPQGIYDNALRMARLSGLAKHIRGIFWYQGESNSGLGYGQKFAALAEAWKSDYPAVEHLYVVQIRPNSCNTLDQNDVREEQRHLGAMFPNLRMIAASGVEGYDGCHFSQAGYASFAGQLYRALAHDSYGVADTTDIVSPNLAKAYFADTTRQTVVLEFTPSSSRIITSVDSLLVDGKAVFIKDAFLCDGRLLENGKSFLDAPNMIASVEASGKNTVRITLQSGIRAERLTYLPDKFYPGTVTVYAGPWLQTPRGMGVLSFFRAPIQPPTVGNK